MKLFIKIFLSLFLALSGRAQAAAGNISHAEIMDINFGTGLLTVRVTSNQDIAQLRVYLGGPYPNYESPPSNCANRGEYSISVPMNYNGSSFDNLPAGENIVTCRPQDFLQYCCIFYENGRSLNVPAIIAAFGANSLWMNCTDAEGCGCRYVGGMTIPPPTATQTFTDSPTPSVTETDSPTETPSVTVTFTATPTITVSPTKTASPTRTATRTRTPEKSSTYTRTPTRTQTKTTTGTFTATPTISATSTATPTRTPSFTFSPTALGSFTRTPTGTHTRTVSPTPTWTPTITNTGTPTWTPTASPSWTNSPSPTPTLTPCQCLTSVDCISCALLHTCSGGVCQ